MFGGSSGGKHTSSCRDVRQDAASVLPPTVPSSSPKVGRRRGLVTFDAVRCKLKLSTDAALLLTVPALIRGFGGAKASTEFGGEDDRSLEDSLERCPASLCLLCMARRNVLRRAATGSPRRSLCQSSSADLLDLTERLDLLLLMLLSSSIIAFSKSRATEPECTIGGKFSWSILGRSLPSARSGLSSSLSVLLSGLSALAMLASVPRRLPWYGSLILGRLSGWLRWSSRSGSGVLYLVCDLSDRGVYDIVSVDFYLI